jgi:hypothetical protein
MASYTNMEDIFGASPMEYLHLSPSDLPGFDTHAYNVYIAIKVDESESEVDLNQHDGRALLLLLKQTRHKLQWGMLQGVVQHSHRNIEAAIADIVTSKTGLHVDNVLGAFDKIQVRNIGDANSAHVKLHFVVTVRELTSLASLETCTISPKGGYTASQWIKSKDDMITLAKTPSQIPTHQQNLTLKAYTFRIESFLESKDYLAMSPSQLPYTDRYRWLVCPIILRPNPFLPLAILLIQRGASKLAAGNWEIVGGNIDFTCSSVEEALQHKIALETGLTMCDILGAVSRTPTIVSASTKPGGNERGLAILDYVVRVEEGEVLLEKEEEYAAVRWVESVEEAEGLLMSRSGRRSVRWAIEAAKTLVQEQEEGAVQGGLAGSLEEVAESLVAAKKLSRCLMRA